MADSDGGFESADEDKQPSTPGTPIPPEVDLTPPVDHSPAAEIESTPAAVLDTTPAPEPAPTPDSPDIKPDPVPPEKSLSPQQPGDDWGWGGWSSWAASSVSNVAGMATNATKGLSGALETFEASLGLPTPEELAEEMRETQLKESDETKESEVKTKEEPPKEEPKEKETKDESASRPGYYPGAGLWSGISSLTNTGTQYLNAGLDKLEEVSNKAYDALNDQATEDFPKTKPRTRDSTKGPSLMNVLQEAKVKYEQQEKISSETMMTMSYLFDEKQGLSQLEALQMLSKECVLKMKNNPSEGNTLFLYVETSLELKSGDSEIIIEHLGAAVTDCLKTLKIDLPISKINQCRYEIAQQLSEMDMTTLDETAKPSDTKKTVLLANSLNSIAGFTARSVELFKKIAELSLLKSTLEVDMKTQADTIKFLNEVLCCEIDNIREQFEQKTESKDDVDRLYLETSNAISYLQETLYFFVPILKWIVVKTSKS
ncbi:protein FAM114A2-like [Bolinopsis microptera]|uniref:protein FAM114A2-like n=1 Tax=Bolinopsis microptera TaxID=2820187 RepID=UPI00307A9113